MTAVASPPRATTLRTWSLLLLPIGPIAVGLLRYLLPYDTTDSTADMVKGAYAHPGRENAVLWLILIAVLTLVPGVLIVLRLTRSAAPRLTAWATAIVVPGYLCLVGGPAAGDVVEWSAHEAHLSQSQATDLLGSLHPSVTVQLIIFVAGHVIGTVLLGLAVLRSRLAPAPIAWALTISQPLHFVAAVILGNHPLDLLAWLLTAAGMAGVALTSMAAGRVDHGATGARLSG